MNNNQQEQINDILEALSRIQTQVKLIKLGNTKTNESKVDRLDVINEKALLIKIIVNKFNNLL